MLPYVAVAAIVVVVIAALIASIEGRVGEPHPRPPYPVEKGLFGKPTVVTVHGLDWQREKWGRFARWYLRTSESMAAKGRSLVIADAKAGHTGKVKLRRECIAGERRFDRALWEVRHAGAPRQRSSSTSSRSVPNAVPDGAHRWDRQRRGIGTGTRRVSIARSYFFPWLAGTSTTTGRKDSGMSLMEAT